MTFENFMIKRQRKGYSRKELMLSTDKLDMRGVLFLIGRQVHNESHEIEAFM